MFVRACLCVRVLKCHVCECVHVCLCVCVFVFVCVYVCMYVYVYVVMCMRTCMCMYATVDHQSRALKRDMAQLLRAEHRAW